MEPLDRNLKKELLNALRKRIHEAITDSDTGIVIFQLNRAEILLKDELMAGIETILLLDDISYQDISSEQTPGVLRIDGSAFKNAKPSAGVNMVNVKNVILPGANVSAQGNLHIGDTPFPYNHDDIVVGKSLKDIIALYLQQKKMQGNSFYYHPTGDEKRLKGLILSHLLQVNNNFQITVLGSDNETDPRESAVYWNITF